MKKGSAIACAAVGLALLVAGGMGLHSTTLSGVPLYLPPIMMGIVLLGMGALRLIYRSRVRPPYGSDLSNIGYDGLGVDRGPGFGHLHAADHSDSGAGGHDAGGH